MNESKHGKTTNKRVNPVRVRADQNEVRNVSALFHLKFPCVTRWPDFEEAYPCGGPNLQFAYRLFPSSIQLILIITLDTHVILRLRRFSKSTPFSLFTWSMSRLGQRGARERFYCDTFGCFEILSTVGIPYQMHI